MTQHWPSQYFSLAEMTRSQTAEEHGIDNTPSELITERLARTAEQMDRIRVLLSAPVVVSSGYRCLKVNALVGSQPTSAHVQGYAVDFTCPQFGPPLAIIKAILSRKIAFDQIIHEGTWVHISFAPTMRGEVLTAVRKGGRTTYKTGLPKA